MLQTHFWSNVWAQNKTEFVDWGVLNSEVLQLLFLLYIQGTERGRKIKWFGKGNTGYLQLRTKKGVFWLQIIKSTMAMFLMLCPFLLPTVTPFMSKPRFGVFLHTLVTFFYLILCPMYSNKSCQGGKKWWMDKMSSVFSAQLSGKIKILDRS